MAASIRQRAACMTGMLLRTRNLFSQSRRGIRYYVLLPEVPPDTEKTNPIMKVDEIPKFSDISSSKLVTGVTKQCMEFETGFEKLWLSLKDKPKTYENFIVPLEKLHFGPSTTCLTAKILFFLNQTIDYEVAYYRIMHKFDSALQLSAETDGFYEALQEIKKNCELEDHQKKYLNIFLSNAIMGGAEMKKRQKEIFLFNKKNLMVLSDQFRANEQSCRKVYREIITNGELLQGLPERILRFISLDSKNPANGPWQLSLNPMLYNSVLKHCKSRQIRWKMWYANVNLCSVEYIADNLANNTVMKEIMMNRKDIAQDMGYDHYADFKLSVFMADNVQQVLPVVEELRNTVYPSASEEFVSLQEFAKENGFKYKLDQWDIPYYRNHQRKEVVKLDQRLVAEHFTIKNVCVSFFELAKKLFGVTFKENKDCPRVHPNVKVYDVYGEDGEHLGTNICDFFAREEKIGGAWVERGRDRCERVGSTPYFYLSFSFDPPRIDNQQILLFYEEAMQIYCHMGYTLQYYLGKSLHAVGHPDSPDVTQVISKLMLYIFKDPAYMKKLSSHYETNEPLSDELVTLVNKDWNHMQSFDMLNELFWIAFDLEMNITHTSWATAYEKVWPLYRLTPLNNSDCSPCSDIRQFNTIGGTVDRYHGTWSEMIAADVFEQFQEVGLDFDQPETQDLGRRLRDKFLFGTSSLPPKERLRHFQGRDVSLEPLKRMFTSE